jgi:hypothetical protein
MSSTALLRATRPLLALLAVLIPSGIRAAEPEPFRRSVAELMSSPPLGEDGPRLAPPRLAPSRRHLGGHPESPRTASAPSASAGAAPAAAPSAPQTLGANFQGATLADTNAFPPDTSGAAGPTQFLVGVNGRIRSFAKATGVADGVMDLTMDAFFETVRNANSTGGPHVRYDRLSSRWIVTINNFNAALANNRVLLAVSDAASNGILSNTTVWTYFYFQHNLVSPAGDTDLFFDSPSLGVDVNGLTIGGNLFDALGDYQGTSVHVVRKSRALSSTGGDLVPSGDVMAFRNLTTTSVGTGPYSPQGVDDLYDAAATESWIAGVDNAGFGALVFRTITFASTGAWPPSGISANLSLVVPATSVPLTVPHQGNVFGADGELDAVDDRLFAASLRDGRLWTAHNISVGSGGVSPGDRNGSRWYEIDVSTGTPGLTQAGTLFDAAATNPRFYWIPAIAVSGQGHAAIGTSASGATQRINAATAGRLAGDPLGALQSPVLYTTNTFSYNPAGDPGPPRRWGDYSFTSVDPSDDMTMWTIQQYCDATDSYAVRVVELVAPPPAAFATAVPDILSTGQASVVVVLTGTSVSGSGYFDPGTGFPNRLQVSVTGGVTVNSVTFTSPTSLTLDLNTSAAAAGPVSVTVTNPDGQQITSASGFLTLNSGVGPVVHAIAPASGPAAGTTAVVLSGLNFVEGAAVTVGGVAATGVDVTSATTADATVPTLAAGELHDVTLTNPDTQSGTLVDGWFADFLDVPQADIFHAYVEKLIRNGVTAGCGGGNYCRDSSVTRAQMAVFLLKSKLGAAYVPPDCTGTVFTDVPCTGGQFDPWIEDLADRGITGGCGGGNYCPGDPVTRAQMSVFLLKTDLGEDYEPPPCTGTVFDDVPCTGGNFDPWIEELASRDITAGCEVSPPLFCPGAANTRGQMAVFLVLTFSLP